MIYFIILQQEKQSACRLLSHCSVTVLRSAGSVMRVRMAAAAARLMVVSGAKVPAVILKHSFHTAAKPTQWLFSDANLKKPAQREAECIAEWLNVPAAPKPTEKDDLYRVRVTIDDLNIRTGPGTKYASKGYIEPGVYRITAEDGIWLKLCSGAGWISSKYAKKI